MRPIALKALTWATVAAAVASALWLAAVEADPAATLRLTASPLQLLPLRSSMQQQLPCASQVAMLLRRSRDRGGNGFSIVSGGAGVA